jgi:hypothetical protein
VTSAKAPVYKTTPGTGFDGPRSLTMAFDIPAICLTCNQWPKPYFELLAANQQAALLYIMGKTTPEPIAVKRQPQLALFYPAKLLKLD